MKEGSKRKLKFAAFVIAASLAFVGVLWLIFAPSRSGPVSQNKTGLNTQLPGANVKGDSAKDKMVFYAAALADSMKKKEQRLMDPNRKDTVSVNVPKIASRGYGHSSYTREPVEERVKSIQKLMYSSPKNEEGNERIVKPKVLPEPDPEMESINATLDKIMAIQNPQSHHPEAATTQKTYSVQDGQGNEATYFGKKQNSPVTRGFYGDQNKNYSEAGMTAVVADEQLLQSGASVKLELVSSIIVNGVTIPARTAVYGIASIEGERLLIHIPSIRYGNSILPVSLSVFDMDGLEGIYIPGSMPRDVLKESADNAIQSTGIAGAGLSIKTQAAAAGIGAAKSLLSKKVKQVRVTVSAGYKVLLRDNKQM